MRILCTIIFSLIFLASNSLAATCLQECALQSLASPTVQASAVSVANRNIESHACCDEESGESRSDSDHCSFVSCLSGHELEAKLPAPYAVEKELGKFFLTNFRPSLVLADLSANWNERIDFSSGAITVRPPLYLFLKKLLIP